MPSIYETVTADIVAAVEAGVAAGTYKMPWHRRGECLARPINGVGGRAYRGVNILLLWAAAQSRGFDTGRWATYRQWQDAGAQVRKGETATPIFFWKQIGAGDLDDVDDVRGARLIAKAYRVFNAAQIDGGDQLPANPPVAIASADAFFARVGAEVQLGGDEAFYHSRTDRIHLPPLEAFVSAEKHYAVLAHELCHWTGAKHRLDRNLAGRFGDGAYAMEELVAEIGAAFLMATLDLGLDPRTDHAPYVTNWLKVLRNDPRAITTAASKAQAAADYILEAVGGGSAQ